MDAPRALDQPMSGPRKPWSHRDSWERWQRGHIPLVLIQNLCPRHPDCLFAKVCPICEAERRQLARRADPQ